MSALHDLQDAKIASWDSTLSLFNYVYQIPVLPPELAATLATAVELGGAVLLALGLGARFGATALSVLNIVAVISFPDLSDIGRQDHFYWGLLLLIFRRPDFVESMLSPISAPGADWCAGRSSRWR